MKTVLIVEDNVRSLEVLVKIVQGIDRDINLKTASSIETAYLLAVENDVDLFLVDIILNPQDSGDVSGIRFANNVRSFSRYTYTPIIFITSLEDPKLYAYSEIHCFQYIEKPYNIVKVTQIIKDALYLPVEKCCNQSIFFRKEGILYKLGISEIMYIENARNGRIIHAVNGDLELPYKPSKAILEELCSSKFVQCSRFTIINKDFIESIDEVNRYIKLRGRKELVEIGIIFKKRFMRNVRDN